MRELRARRMLFLRLVGVLRLREEAPMSVDCCDGEPCVVDYTTRQRARIEHKCSCCGETIPRTHFYFRQFLVWGGTIDTIKRCARCQALYDALVTSHPGDWETAVALRLDCGHSYREVYEADPPPELARLAFLTPDEMQADLAQVKP